MASQNTEGGTENQPLSAVALGDGYWKSVATIGHQVASALEYAHQQGTMHRDIKPANLIIDTQGTVWVADFGLAKAMEQDDVSRTGDIIGTLKYMAPEQLNGHADARSDLYSLGLTLYELVSLESAWSEAESRRRFAAQSASLSPPMLRNHNPAIPRDLETIIHKLIAIEPKHRYQTADQLSADLQRFLGGRPILARRSTPWERLSRWARRNPALAGASGAATLLMCTVALVSTLGYLQVSKANQETKLALHEEQLQRQTADERESLALSALDRIFERFAPGGLPLSVDDSSDDSTPIVSAGLSTEAADLLQELVEYYQKLREQSGDDPAYQKRIAQANRRLGDIDQRLGRYEQAQQAYEQALLLYTQLTVESPGHNRAIAGLHVEIGNTYRQQRQFADAERSYAAAEQLLEPMASQHGGEAAAAELARVYYLQIRGNNRRRRGGRSQTARVAIDREATELKLDRAIQIMDELTLGHPNVTIYAHTLALLYLEASSFHSRENPTDSNGFHERAIVELESLTEMSPTNPEYAFALCGALSTGSSRSNRLSYQDLDSFAERLTRALSAITEIVEAHPQVPEYRDFQARIHQKLGNVLMRLEFYPEAEQRYQAAIDGYGVLASRFPESARQYEMKRVFARQALAGLLMQSDSAEAVTRARDELLAATDTLKSAAADADNPESIQSRLTRCRHQLDECSQQLGRMNHSPSESL